jgi:hypothetical protein
MDNVQNCDSYMTGDGEVERILKKSALGICLEVLRKTISE